MQYFLIINDKNPLLTK